MRLEGIIRNVGVMQNQPTRTEQTFKKITIYVEEAGVPYPQGAVFQLKNDVATSFNGKVGDYAIVDFNLRTFTSPHGVICNCLDAWHVKTIAKQNYNN